MVDYDYKFFIPDTPENRRKLEEKGITQVEDSTDACDWYVSPSDIAEDWGGTEEELDALIEEKIDERLMFQRLIDQTFPAGYLVIYGNKKNALDETRRVWKTNDFWEALEKLREWIDQNFSRFLEFGNDDLNGWTLVAWKVPTKKLHELAKKCSEIVS